MKSRSMRRVTARYNWERLSVSFWFAPAVMAVLAALFAWAVYWLDGQIPNQALADSRIVLAGSVDQLRSALITIATSTLTTAGVVFTLLSLPLGTVVAQYGSRLLRVFLGDRTTQFVLGMFVFTFVYSVAAALTIPPATVNPEAPLLTASVGLYLMLGTFASLILLVQHISTMLQAPNIAAAAGAALLSVVSAEALPIIAIDADAADGRGEPPPALESLLDAEGFAVRMSTTGYIQYIDPAMMLTLAHEENLVVRLLQKPGNFVSPGEVVALVWPASRIDEKVENQLRRAFRIGNVRTPTQDIEYAVNQLTEMAVRAMSPAINDPFTAMTCLDHMGNGLALYVQEREENPEMIAGRLRFRLVYEPVTFAELLSAAFDMLRHVSCDNATVLQRMLHVIDGIGQVTRSQDSRLLLHGHVALILAESKVGNLVEEDRRRIEETGQALLGKLAGAPKAEDAVLTSDS
jgi:uncharacterized membrane protein